MEGYKLRGGPHNMWKRPVVCKWGDFFVLFYLFCDVLYLFWFSFNE